MSLDLKEMFTGGSTFYHHIGPEDPSSRKKIRLGNLSDMIPRSQNCKSSNRVTIPLREKSLFLTLSREKTTFQGVLKYTLKLFLAMHPMPFEGIRKSDFRHVMDNIRALALMRR